MSRNHVMVIDWWNNRLKRHLTKLGSKLDSHEPWVLSDKRAGYTEQQ